MTHRNVELKARCADPDGLARRLLALGATERGTDAQTDVYYRVPRGRLKLRRGGIENNLIHYDRPDGNAPKESLVSLYPLGTDRALDAVLDAALDRDVVVRKSRRILWLGNVKFHLDTVEDLGSFLEVEAIDYDGDLGTDVLRAQCDEYLRLLEIRSADLEARSYSDLLRELG
ncbi:class IV adenylate cyclase [Saccharomonospora saliphila]|uniref:class IV adenylate cyclase n=1 Tax=Saccharomonospora saliphila TaxID=369829 RepID=UPI000381B434|nr:class IV adenylate cyclase [Saccharomonospora saliphila]